MLKKKFTLEFAMKRTPVNVLWQYIATPSGLEEWFADKATQDGKKFIFTWNNYDSEATLLSARNGIYSRWRWDEDDDDKSFFELKISVSELTDETTLTVADFATDVETPESIELWEHQIEALQRLLGC